VDTIGSFQVRHRAGLTIASGLVSSASVLHCDKLSWFRHIEALTVGFGVQALMVSGDNGLSATAGFGGSGRI
jgi:hypothetical protein